MRALLHRMRERMLGLGDHAERLPRMSWLSTTGFAARFSQAVRLGFLEAIAGWRLATVLAILGKLVFQPLNSRPQRANGYDQSMHQGENGFFAIPVSRTDLFIGGQVYWFHRPQYR